MNPRGQAVVETLLAVSVLITLCIGAFFMAYLCFARLWIQYQMERSVLCAAVSSPQICARTLERRVKSTLPFGEWRAHSWSAGENYYLKASYKLAGKVEWQWQRQLQIERIGKKARRRSL